MFLKKLDFLSPNITLYYFNEKRHSSVAGGLLTIIMIIFSLYVIIHYSFIKVYPSNSSLLMYRNYAKEINMHFNKTGLFHYIWIFNENILNNNITQNLLQLNSLKRGIIRIYMTYSYDKYEYNSSNLKDNDHWVYDTCSTYMDDNELKYDFSFSSCIKYYYNSIDKKYYSINDGSNFKYPFLQFNNSSFENIFFGTFIERCSNDSLINGILGDCYPDEKINDFLINFNHIFLSFMNIRFKANDEPVEFYSHKIYDNLNYGRVSYIHELKFIPFSYKYAKGLLSKKEFNSFMFYEDKTSTLYHSKNENLLMAYIFKSEKYISEFRIMNDGILELINSIGGSIFLIYYIFYIINNIICERVEIRNFQWFLNNKNNSLIYRHINYDRNEFFSLKTDLSNDLINKNDYTNTFKSTYLGAMLKNNLTNINNNTNDEINQKVTSPKNNNYTIKINKIETESKGKSKNGDNIIVINNNSFMNENTNNNIISTEKGNNSFKLEERSRYSNRFSSKLDDINNYRKTLTYNKPPVDSTKGSKLKTVIKSNINFINQRKKSRIIDSDAYNSKRKDSADFNSRQKIIDTSTISLLNSTNPNKAQNYFINNSYNYTKKDKQFTPLSSIRNPQEFNYGSKNNARVHISEKSLLKDSTSLNHKKDIISHSPLKNKDKINKITNITFDIKGRRKSHQHVIINTTNNDKDEKKGKEKIKKSGVFLKVPEKHSERHLSLFSRHSNCIYPNDKILDIKSQKNDKNEKNIIEQIKRTNIMRKKIKKNQSSEIDSKNFRRFKNETKFAKIIQNYKLYPKYIWDYICLCRQNGNSVYLLNDFRKKLLSEEYLYILHINMFIFKQKYGCKSNFEHSLLLEELYNDY